MGATVLVFVKLFTVVLNFTSKSQRIVYCRCPSTLEGGITCEYRVHPIEKGPT